MDLRSLWLLFVLFAAACPIEGRALELWYDHPARHAITEGLPLGNGRLGALVLGGVTQERLVLDEDSLWTGDRNPSGNYDTMGAYQFLGEVLVELPGQTNVTGYRRELDLSEAIGRVTYIAQGVTCHREYFCSHPAGVFIARFTADRPGSWSGTVTIRDSHHAPLVVGSRRLAAIGALTNGLKYAWEAAVELEGGTLTTNGTSLVFSHADALTLIVAAGTDYAMDFDRGYRGADPQPGVAARVAQASRKSFEGLRAEHIRDYQRLFNRVALDLGRSADNQRALPTDLRKRTAAETFDPELEQLLFQYGRYLLISCSRPGGLPANLQGLWNDSNNPPWHSDYHANINIEMNYWPAEPANLAECHEPLLDLIRSQLPAWREAAAAAPELRTPSGAPTARGFALRTSHNTMGGMGWKWDKTANAWYCLHFWEHYAFGQEQRYLREIAYPVLKETCQYWEDHLKVLPNGRLVVPHAWSPEHGPEEDGVSYSQEIVYDLFEHYVRAADVLGVDQSYRNRVAALRDRLVTPGIGSWGQLLEWMTEKRGTNALAQYPELDTPRDHHRHTSHLFAVYPGAQIGVLSTPALAAAAKVSLDARGTDPNSDVREWSLAWRTALYARLHDAESAHRLLQWLFADRNTCPNLFGLHPPMQIDGNFGITAAVCEMLLQSQQCEPTGSAGSHAAGSVPVLELLPALPNVWASGSVRGLRTRGGFEVDESWRDGKLTRATIHSSKGGRCEVRSGGRTLNLNLRPGQTQTLGAELSRE